MFNLNLQYIAGGLAIFFITLAVYKGLSQKASKRESAAKSLEQSHVGQDPKDSNVSLHNPFPGATVPSAPSQPDNQQPPGAAQAAPSPSTTAPTYQPPPTLSSPAAPATHVPPVPVTPPAPPTPEEIYKWN